MGLRETEEATELILKRMENTLSSMEQMSFDSINVTDRIVTLTSEARECTNMIRGGSQEEREKAFEDIGNILSQILDTSFTVNNIAHELEKETLYQRDTSENLRQVIDFLYAMAQD